MEKHIHDKRRFSLNKILSDEYIPYLGGRPERGTIIGKHDVIDLKIALNITADVNEFVESL